MKKKNLHIENIGVIFNEKLTPLTLLKVLYDECTNKSTTSRLAIVNPMNCHWLICCAVLFMKNPTKTANNRFAVAFFRTILPATQNLLKRNVVRK